MRTTRAALALALLASSSGCYATTAAKERLYRAPPTERSVPRHLDVVSIAISRDPPRLIARGSTAANESWELAERDVPGRLEPRAIDAATPPPPSELPVVAVYRWGASGESPPTVPESLDLRELVFTRFDSGSSSLDTLSSDQASACALVFLDSVDEGFLAHVFLPPPRGRKIVDRVARLDADARFTRLIAPLPGERTEKVEHSSLSGVLLFGLVHPFTASFDLATAPIQVPLFLHELACRDPASAGHLLRDR